jgi:hypothetical protein
MFLTEKELEQPSEHTRMICAQKMNDLNPIYYDDYTNWKSNQNNDYSNFMEMTTQPQNNPFGIAGNREAMKSLELQKPVRQSTQNNPFMNVEIQDYNIPQKYGRSKGYCDDTCKKNYYRLLIQSPDDALWQRQASERQFYTTPNTSVPNEQKKFAEWLYGKNFVGKTGTIYSRYGYPYTPDSLVNTGFNAASPENAGQVDNNYGTPITTPNASPWVNNPNYGYGFGGIPGAIPFHNIEDSPPNMQMMPMPLFPVFPPPIPYQHYNTVPNGINN